MEQPPDSAGCSVSPGTPKTKRDETQDVIVTDEKKRGQQRSKSVSGAAPRKKREKK
jgi:hypothetical protein